MLVHPSEAENTEITAYVFSLLKDCRLLQADFIVVYNFGFLLLIMPNSIFCYVQAAIKNGMLSSHSAVTFGFKVNTLATWNQHIY